MCYLCYLPFLKQLVWWFQIVRFLFLQTLEAESYWPDQAVFFAFRDPVDQGTRIQKVNLDLFYQM